MTYLNLFICFIVLLLGLLCFLPAEKQWCFKMFTPILSVCQNLIHVDQTEGVPAVSEPGNRPMLTCFDAIMENGRLKDGFCPAVTAFQ